MAHCTCCIIPPRLLRQLAQRACSEAERCDLLDQAQLSARLRDQRSAAVEHGAEPDSGPAPLAPPLMTALAPATPSAVTTGKKQRSVYDAGQLGKLPGVLLRAEGAAAVNDQHANQAYDGAGLTYDFLRKIFNRQSIDGKGMRLDSTIHFQQHFNNAFWNGQQMVYGDGDGKSFIGFTGSIDVIAHELTHGLIQYAVPGGLNYEGQSGALNESIADVFGSVVKQWSLQQSSRQADWLIGAGIMGPGVGKALRSLADPGNTELTWSGDDQPKTFAAYVEGGAVHTNSGIPNHAFYALCMALKGNAWRRAAPIWYRSLALLTPTATFADMARATAQAAATLHGVDSAEQRAVRAAWQLVGVDERK